MKKTWVLSQPLSAREDSDQTGRMPRLIWVFAGRIGHFVGFVMSRLPWCRPRCLCSCPVWGLGQDVEFDCIGSWPLPFLLLKICSYLCDNCSETVLSSFSVRTDSRARYDSILRIITSRGQILQVFSPLQAYVLGVSKPDIFIAELLSVYQFIMGYAKTLHWGFGVVLYLFIVIIIRCQDRLQSALWKYSKYNHVTILQVFSPPHAYILSVSKPDIFIPQISVLQFMMGYAKNTSLWFWR